MKPRHLGRWNIQILRSSKYLDFFGHTGSPEGSRSSPHHGISQGFDYSCLISKEDYPRCVIIVGLFQTVLSDYNFYISQILLNI